MNVKLKIYVRPKCVHHIVCLATCPLPLSKRILQRMRYIALFFIFFSYIFSFPKGYPVTAYIFFLVFPSLNCGISLNYFIFVRVLLILLGSWTLNIV
jgi:hypothetical protein